MGEAACLRTPCPSVWSSGQPPLNLETCYEKTQKDECLCEMEPAKKPCNKLPIDQCPPEQNGVPLIATMFAGVLSPYAARLRRRRRRRRRSRAKLKSAIVAKAC